MTDPERGVLLDAIADELDGLERDLVGTVERSGDAVRILGGRAAITAEIRPNQGEHSSIAHAHVFTSFASALGDVLEACSAGLDADRSAALRGVARDWTAIAFPAVLSAVLARPVLGAEHFSGSERWGVRDRHGFVGPLGSRLAVEPHFLDAVAREPIFEDADRLAPAGRLHMVKATLNVERPGRWRRSLEIDGHAVSHVDHDAPIAALAPEAAILIRFAVFHQGDRPDEVEARRALLGTIDEVLNSLVATARVHPGLEIGDVVGAVATRLPERLARRVHVFAPIAFARVALVDLGVRFSREFIVASTGEWRALMDEPVFVRALVVAPGFLAHPDLGDAARRIAMASSEFGAVNQALHGGAQPEDLVLQPPIVSELDPPEREAGARRRWQFWK